MAKRNSYGQLSLFDSPAFKGLIDESEDEILDFKYSINSYGADYPVDGLVKRLNAETIFIPHFQRDYVWTMTQASRFVESLLLGLPVPGIFLTKEQESQKLLVIDGQQRLRSLQYFYKGTFKKKVFALEGVQKRYMGKTYDDLDPEDKLRLDDAIIHATIIKQDEPSDDNSSIYHIFERLNTGGVRLLPQEIRACIYHGEFNEFISELNNYHSWRNIFGTIPNPRLKDQEFILRFFALNFDLESYEKPLKNFLNTYMSKNRYLQLQNKNILSKTFYETIDMIYKTIGKKAFRKGSIINATIFDSVMVGVAKRLERGPIINNADFIKQYYSLLENSEYLDATAIATSDENAVRTRIRIAIQYFLGVE